MMQMLERLWGRKALSGANVPSVSGCDPEETQ